MENKDKLYKRAITEIRERILYVKDIVPRMATITAVLKNTIPYYYWCGFYFAEEEELVIGPYQGTSACPNIAYSGVCGASVKKKSSIIVPDVHKFPGHIPCDEKSNAEIVVPLIDKEGRTIGVFDVDSTKFSAFDETDRKYLEKIISLLFKK